MQNLEEDTLSYISRPMYPQSTHDLGIVWIFYTISLLEEQAYFSPFEKEAIIIYSFIYLLYLTLVYKIVKNNSTNKYQQYQVKI